MRSSRTNQRGGTLLITLLLLLVLTALGVAAVSLSSQERLNASSQARYQKMVECASAAQSMIWAQLARYGTNYIGSNLPVGVVNLPDGSQLAAPVHYNMDPSTTFANVIYTVKYGGGGIGMADADLTNSLGGQKLGGGSPTLIGARCTDPSGRQFEVEVSFVLAL
jgi:hypothetical protein